MKHLDKSNQFSQRGAVLIEMLLISGLLLLLIFGAVVLSARARGQTRLTQVNRSAASILIRQCGDLIRNKGEGLQPCMQQAATAVLRQAGQSFAELKVLFSAYGYMTGDGSVDRTAYAQAEQGSPGLAAEQSRFTHERVSGELKELLDNADIVIIIETLTPATPGSVPFVGFLQPQSVFYELSIF